MLNVSSNPHVRDKMTTGRIMQLVVIALLPTTLFGVWNFGLHALLVILVSLSPEIANTDVGTTVVILIFALGLALGTKCDVTKEKFVEKIPLGHPGLYESTPPHYEKIVTVMPVNRFGGLLTFHPH